MVSMATTVFSGLWQKYDILKHPVTKISVLMERALDVYIIKIGLFFAILEPVMSSE